MPCQNVVYETNDEKQYSQRITESLNRFLSLKEKCGQNITIRLTESVPPFSIIALNLGKADAVMQVELYSYAVPTRERVEFVINKKDSHMYKFFTQQIKTLQDKSEIYENSTVKLQSSIWSNSELLVNSRRYFDDCTENIGWSVLSFSSPLFGHIQLL